MVVLAVNRLSKKKKKKKKFTAPEVNILPWQRLLLLSVKLSRLKLLMKKKNVGRRPHWRLFRPRSFSKALG